MVRTPSVGLDDTNLEIIELLQKNCKLRVQKIAEEVGKGVSTVHARIKAMEEKGVIKQYSAVMDPSYLDRSTLALIFITIRYRIPGSDEVLSQKEFCEEIAKHPLVQSVFILSGEYDVFLKVRTKNVEEMNRFIVDYLRPLPAVDKTLTMFAMENFLETLEIRDLL